MTRSKGVGQWSAHRVDTAYTAHSTQHTARSTQVVHIGAATPLPPFTPSSQSSPCAQPPCPVHALSSAIVASFPILEYALCETCGHAPCCRLPGSRRPTSPSLDAVQSVAAAGPDCASVRGSAPSFLRGLTAQSLRGRVDNHTQLHLFCRVSLHAVRLRIHLVLLWPRRCSCSFSIDLSRLPCVDTAMKAGGERDGLEKMQSDGGGGGTGRYIGGSAAVSASARSPPRVWGGCVRLPAQAALQGLQSSTAAFECRDGVVECGERETGVRQGG